MIELYLKGPETGDNGDTGPQPGGETPPADPTPDKGDDYSEDSKP
jgi:hypothetical protein